MLRQPKPFHTAAIALFWSLWLALGFVADASAFPAYFSPPKRESGDISMFKKWLRVLDTHPKDLNKALENCPNDQCKPAQWEEFVSSAESLGRESQIYAVNDEMNRSPYITDLVNWGMDDYWETPLQFINRSGDCEDYAIAKYMTLRELGFSPEDMRIVILKDSNINMMHAVLVVSFNGRALVLDNYIPKVTESTRIKHYHPIYAINENHWWRH
ncbi:hypothetical protein GC177_03370 [bacterium]|nr:hypothetical protein [bacterium]